MAKLSVRELLDGKGTCQRTFVQVTTAEQAVAAEEAGIEMIGTAYLEERRTIPNAVPNTHFQFGLQYGKYVNADEAMRAAFSAIEDGATTIYCAMSTGVIERLAREGVPVIGHVGLVPPLATWVGGLRAVGKSPEQAVAIYRKVKDLEAAGAFAVEMEIIPHRLASEISRRTSLFTISLGSGRGCDAQYLFSADILGEASRVPRHAKTYRNLAAEYTRLQGERVAAYAEFAADVGAGRFPSSAHTVEMTESDFERFLHEIE